MPERSPAPEEAIREEWALLIAMHHLAAYENLPPEDAERIWKDWRNPNVPGAKETAAEELECARRVLNALLPAIASWNRRAASKRESFQARVAPWMQECFGPEISADHAERNHRFLEEGLELAQACGCTESEAHQLVSYVYNRPDGDVNQEVGGVMVTLAALCLANGLDMHAAGETELARVWGKIDQIRAKQAAKPKHSPLPQYVEASGREKVLEQIEREARKLRAFVSGDGIGSFDLGDIDRAFAAYDAALAENPDG